MHSVLLILSLATAFPNVELPRSPLLPGTVAGDSLCKLSFPQQLIPGYCKNILSFGGDGRRLLITVPGEDHGLLCLQRPTDDDPWSEVSALGPCDSLDLAFFFPALLAMPGADPTLTMVVKRENTGSPYAFFQAVATESQDSCIVDGIVLTDPELPDSGETAHYPSLAIPVTAAQETDRLAVGVWDTYTWDTYLFFSQDGGLSFTPGPEDWSTAIPRPDSGDGGPTLLAASPTGELVACALAEATDSLHLGLQPWINTSSDWGTSWDEPLMLASAADGSSLEEIQGSMPYGSFTGGTTWYGADLLFSGDIPYLFWTARRSFRDTVTMEEKEWPSARALICSYPMEETWTSVYIGRALTDTLEAYDGADWPTAVVDEQGRLVVFWSDRSDLSPNLDIWATGHDPETGIWTEPVQLTSTPGNEAMLEALPVIQDGLAMLLLADAALLVGEETALRLATIDITPIWEAPPRTDVRPAPWAAIPVADVLSLPVHVAPSPVGRSFRIIAAPGLQLKKIEIFDLAGRRRGSLSETQIEDRSYAPHGLPPGAYVLRWKAEESQGSIPLLVLR